MNKLFDKDLEFEESTHTYSLKTDPSFVFTSATTFIHNFFEKFDKEKIAKNLITKPKYEGLTTEDLIADWDKSASDGTMIHKQLETYLENKRTRPKHLKGKQGVKWIKDILKPEWDVYTEVMVYSKELGISGMMDVLVYNPVDNKYAIVDWKTNKKIYTHAFGGRRGTRGSTANLEDCNFIHYSLQLSLYRYLLEEYYGLDVSSQVIVHLREADYKEYKCEYLKYSLIKMIKDKEINGFF